MMNNCAFAQVATEFPDQVIAGERHEDKGEQNIVDGLVLRQPGDRAGIGIDRAPEINRRNQRHQPEHTPKEKVRPINEGVLNTHVDDVPIFLHSVS